MRHHGIHHVTAIAGDAHHAWLNRAAQAALELAKLELSYTNIVAPYTLRYVKVTMSFLAAPQNAFTTMTIGSNSIIPDATSAISDVAFTVSLGASVPMLLASRARRGQRPSTTWRSGPTAASTARARPRASRWCCATRPTRRS